MGIPNKCQRKSSQAHLVWRRLSHILALQLQKGARQVHQGRTTFNLCHTACISLACRCIQPGQHILASTPLASLQYAVFPSSANVGRM